MQPLSKNDATPSDISKPAELQYLDPSPLNWRMSSRPLSWKPPTDIYETDEMIVVRVESAGMREVDFTIELKGRLLSIHGMRQDASERRAYHQMEIRFGEFNIDLELPFPIEADQVQATYHNGFLRVSLPKARPRHIPIVE